MRHKKILSRFGKGVLYGVLVLWTLVCLYPLIWMLSTSFKTMSEVARNTMALIPEAFRWENYVEAWTKGNFGVYFKNSLIVTVTTLLLVLWTASMTAFAVARTDFPGKQLILFALVATLFIPAEATLVPVFHIAKNLGLLNSLAGLIVVSTAGAQVVSIYLIQAYFRTIPRDLDDAARIDGCNLFQMYWHVVLPLAKPVLATVAILTFMGTWNAYLLPLAFTMSRPELRTLPVGLVAFQSGFAFSVNWPLLCAGAAISLMPIVVLYVFLQRYFVSGIAAGALKE
ncbi:MAG TPA: carbohydrate ABC transporter permease [Candidatus Latescibacteria bacterium]|nr:carbohydrate ABC transporter permease [Candidatus Latescibacterota bacterium]